MHQLVDISFAPSFDIEHLPKFKEICERHLVTVVENFPNSSVSLNQHYTIHYPYLLEQHGLLSEASCLRFEGVHQVHKQFASNSKTLKNIQYTMACKFKKRAAYDQARIDFVEEEIIFNRTKEIMCLLFHLFPSKPLTKTTLILLKQLLPSLQAIILFCTKLVTALFLYLNSLVKLLFTNAFQQFFTVSTLFYS